MCWPINTCDWSCRFSTCSASLRLCVSASQKIGISHTVQAFTKNLQLLAEQFLTWLEQNNGLQAGKLSRVNSQDLELIKDLFQDALISCGDANLGLLCGRKIWHREKRTAVQGQGPLDGRQEEHLTPTFFKENYLSKSNMLVSHRVHACENLFCKPRNLQVNLTWSRKGKREKTGTCFAHLTDMKSSRADVS